MSYILHVLGLGLKESLLTYINNTISVSMTKKNPTLIMHELPGAVIVAVDVNVQPEDARPGRTGQENVASITWIALVSETSSTSVHCPNSGSSFHLREKITRTIV